MTWKDAMDPATKTFCDMIKNRSEENRRAIRRLCFENRAPMPDFDICRLARSAIEGFGVNEVMSPAISVLRQELDSMVRVIYLLSIKDIGERRRLITSTLRGEKWRRKTLKGKWKDVTDREMVELSQTLQGWTHSVYTFGCAFIHLSNFHNHLAENPFDRLSLNDKIDILNYMRIYHGGPCHDNPNMSELAILLPNVFDKIATNLTCYLNQLEQNEKL